MPVNCRRLRVARKTLAMKVIVIISWMILHMASITLGQQKKIESDRPGETRSASVAELNYIQLEAGFRKDWQSSGDYVLLNPEVLIKYGLLKGVELRLEMMAETDKFYSRQEYRYGLMPVEVGLKANLSEEKGLLPKTSFLGQAGIPRLASKSHQTDHVPVELRLLFENTLQKKLKLHYNIGAEWEGDNANPDWMFSLSPQFDISGKFSVFLEEYGIMRQGEKPEHYFDAGFDYYLTNNIKIDLFAGLGISTHASDYFVSSGISFRFK